MAANLISVDPRCITPLFCNPEDTLATWPADTLHRASITLQLLANLLGGYSGEEPLLSSDNQRFAVYLQLRGIADLIGAVSDALAEAEKEVKP